VSDRTEPDMSFGLLEPAKSPVQLKPDFWLEPMSHTLNDLEIKMALGAFNPIYSFALLNLLKVTFKSILQTL